MINKLVSRILHNKNDVTFGMLFGCAVLVALLSVSPAAANGKVILTFDDGVQGFPNDCSAEIMWTYGFRGVSFFQTNAVTWQPVGIWQTLLLRGWEFGSHTANHAHLNSLSAATLEFEVAESKRWMEQLFHTRVVSFAYPYVEGVDNATVRQALRDAGYLYARSGGFSTWRGEQSFQIGAYEFTHYVYQTKVQQLINAAKTYGVAVGMFHGVNAELSGWNALSPSDFEYVLAAIKKSGVEVCTFNDLL